jgi:hypothetical protein
MTVSRKLVIFIAAIVMVAANCICLEAQAVSKASQSPSITVSIAMENSLVLMGKKPVAILTIKNISHQVVGFSPASDLCRVHVEGKDGEPARTEWNRHLRGDYRPGDGPYLVDGPVVTTEVAPGSSDFRKYDLSDYYDLSVPGKYSIYIEFYDPLGPPDLSGLWLRTRTEHFEIQPPNQ